MDDLELEFTDDTEGQTVVAAVGEIIHSTAPAFHDALLLALDRSEKVVVDLAGVEYVGSDGIRALMLVNDEARRRGRRLTVRHRPPVLLRLLPILGLEAEAT